MNNDNTTCRPASSSIAEGTSFVSPATAETIADNVPLSSNEKNPTNPFSSLSTFDSSSISSDVLTHPWVSVWQRENCLMYLFGSTHYSPQSIRLATTLVQTVAPTLVFVELCRYSMSISRLTRFFEHQLYHHRASTEKTSTMDPPFEVSTLNILYPHETHSIVQRIFGTSNTLPAGFISASRRLQPATATTNRSQGNEGTVSFACEFCHAAWEGHIHGAWGIVMGDRNQWVTNSRYLWINLSSLFQYMSHYFDVRQRLAQWKQEMAKLDAEEAEIDTWGIFPTRDTIKQSLDIVRQMAPIYYQVIVQERDAYLAAGITAVARQLQQELQQERDTRGSQSSTPCSMVAVLGKAHIHGVEQLLQQQGWKQQQ